eukprot:CAMPEP_0206402146 /NCGR_PEP_ID=MMETSP0294-20121207/26768_1 /ASSEMBLY_ACC=CAM_ASM_000327 /TAXON_ID=39354 /ORGANISM="Heterosigma akashiwo, Strain CCMP2393" /LENGTH=34 /DNA_ID= /DNA_START= /DNA_END= /DNA_ORIENTATION=
MKPTASSSASTAISPRTGDAMMLRYPVSISCGKV